MHTRDCQAVGKRPIGTQSVILALVSSFIVFKSYFVALVPQKIVLIVRR